SVEVTDTGKYRLTGGSLRSLDSGKSRDLDAFIKFAKEQIGTFPVTGLEIEDSVTTVENGRYFMLKMKGLWGDFYRKVVNKSGDELRKLEIDGLTVKFQVNDGISTHSDVSFRMLDAIAFNSRSMGGYSASFNKYGDIIIGRPKIKN
ncbi:TPA: hypothetical protein EYG96_01635, partial [Candidatus Gracilibacteria bacterium]|nr:hypothetical protein [Candidatus Gracilibacteria bacterium]